jgi:hypothetical protein
MKQDLLTKATVIDDAIRFVCQKSEEKQKLSANATEDDKESNEADYDEDEDQLEEETGEINTIKFSDNKLLGCA